MQAGREFGVSWEQGMGLGSVGSHTDRFIYIAMVEEVTKDGRRVGAHLNAVAPDKIKCV